MTNIIISDEYGQHGLDIRTAINIGYGEDISSRIQIIPYWSPAFAEARDNSNIIALIRSATGISGYINNATSIYPRVLTFVPMGSNSFTELNTFQNNEPPIIVTSGAGDVGYEDRNNTAYGKGLEFWDNDLVQDASGDQSSFSNGIILGKLLKIKDTLNCTWWEARYRARITADRTEPNRETSMWDLRNGYGRIDVDAAIAYVGLIPADPYLEVEEVEPEEPEETVPVTIKNSTNSFNKSVEPGTIVTLNNINIYKGGQIVGSVPAQTNVFVDEYLDEENINLIFGGIKMTTKRYVIITGSVFDGSQYLTGVQLIEENEAAKLVASGHATYDPEQLLPVYVSDDQTKIRAVECDYSVSSDDKTVIATTAGNIYLMDAIRVKEKEYEILNHSSGKVTVSCEEDGQTINDSESIILNKKWDGIRVKSDGENYWKLP